jgi:hypothetical protein
VTAQLERTAETAAELGEERVCSAKTVVAELLEALSIEEARLAHFQGAGQKDHGRSYVAAAVRRERRPDSSEGVFQALSMINSVALPQETPCLRSRVQSSAIWSDW